MCFTDQVTAATIRWANGTVLSVSKVLSNERGQSRCHLAGEKELFGSPVYMHLLNRQLQPESLV